MKRHLLFTLLLFFICCQTKMFAQKTLTGQVLDSNKEPIIGASVRVKGTEIYSSTDLDGYYYLRNVESGNEIIFAYIGCVERKIKYKGQDEINIVLENNDRFRWGLTVGCGAGTDVRDYSLFVSYFVRYLNGGLTFEIPLKNAYFIVPELIWVRGWAVMFYNGPTRLYNENHIQVPVNLMKKFRMGRKANFDIYAGLYVGYMWENEGDWRDWRDTGDMAELNQLKSQAVKNHWDKGISLGSGFEVSHFFIKWQCRYALETGRVTYDNLFLDISVGYLF